MVYFCFHSFQCLLFNFFKFLPWPIDYLEECCLLSKCLKIFLLFFCYLSMGFSGQQYWSGVPLPSPSFRLDLSKLTLTCLPAISGYWSGSLCLLLYIVSPCRQRLTRNPQVPSVRVGGWGSVPGKSRWGGFPCWDPRLWRSDSLWSWYTSHCGTNTGSPQTGFFQHD